MSRVPTTDLLRVRAALSVGLPPSEALAGVDDPMLAETARLVRLGRPLAVAARAAADDPGALGAGPLLRALALAERSGQGAVDAVDVALRTRHDALIDEQRLQARSAQASGTARLLTALPVAAWLLQVAADPAALRFYATPVGWACAAVTLTLGALAYGWSRRLVRRASLAAALADPLAGRAGPFDRGRAAMAATPVLLAVSLLGHPLLAVAAGGAIAAWAGRPRTPRHVPPCTTLEVVQLLGMLIAAGTALPAALDHLAEVTGPPLAGEVRAIAQRLRTGSQVEPAFAGTGLAEVGAVLAITEHWGIATAGPLRLLSDAVRARQRAAAETAAERVQLALVFPTTLLTLPAFVIAVVPPMVWTAVTA